MSSVTLWLACICSSELRAFVPGYNERMTPRAAYLHVPFCAHHCGYCDFAVSAEHDHLIDLYLEAIGLELAGLGQPRPVDTIFLGGGTPTYLNARQLEQLLTDIRKWFLVPNDTEAWEFSIESTPDSISAEKIAVLADFGVNRISIGVQTFHAGLLPVLDRIHGPDQIVPAIETAAPANRANLSRFDLCHPRPNHRRLGIRFATGYRPGFAALVHVWSDLREGNAALESAATGTDPIAGRRARTRNVPGGDRSTALSRLRALRNLQLCPPQWSLPAQRGVLG